MESSFSSDSIPCLLELVGHKSNRFNIRGFLLDNFIIIIEESCSECNQPITIDLCRREEKREMEIKSK